MTRADREYALNGHGDLGRNRLVGKFQFETMFDQLYECPFSPKVTRARKNRDPTRHRITFVDVAFVQPLDRAVQIAGADARVAELSGRHEGLLSLPHDEHFLVKSSRRRLVTRQPDGERPEAETDRRVLRSQRNLFECDCGTAEIAHCLPHQPKS